MLEVSIFLDEDDRYRDKPMYEYILRYLMHHQIAGASVFTAMGGYGAKRHLHFPRKLGFSDEGPLMILFIDEEPKVQSVRPQLKEAVREGLIVVKKVERVL